MFMPGAKIRVKALGNEFKVLAGPEINMMMDTQSDAFSAWDTWEPVVHDFGGQKPSPCWMARIMPECAA